MRKGQITSEKTRQKLSVSGRRYYENLTTEEHKKLCEDHVRSAQKRGPVSPETCAKISASLKGLKRRPISSEDRRLRSLRQSQRIIDGKAITPTWSKVKRGLYYSSKMCQNVRYDSGFELRYLKGLDISQYIRSFSRCDFHIEYVNNCGIAHYYIPDFLVCLVDGQTVIVEVKPNGNFLELFYSNGKFPALIDYCRSQGHKWLIYSNGLINDDLRLIIEEIR